MTTTTEYLGRKITVRARTNRTTGQRFVSVAVNGKHVWNDANTQDEARSIRITKAYIDDSNQRPGAYPSLEMA